MGNESNDFLRSQESEDDVEGHGFKPARGTGEGVNSRTRATEDDDVEGHGFKPARGTGEGVNSRPRATEDDDVEGHGLNRSARNTGE